MELTITVLNNLDILVCDIQNAYVTATCCENICIIAGQEFGSDQGSVIMIKTTLYGLKGSGAAFKSKLVVVIWDLGYRLTPTDPDAWIRPTTNKQRMNYDEMVLYYVDDILAMSHNLMDTMKLRKS